jgi:glucose-1-phosphate thymidylyltransferase
MKALLLAGGTGSRLYPTTRVVNKHLLLLGDKPVIYYPLSTLLELGLREIAIVSTPAALPLFRDLLGNGRAWGIQLSYLVQPQPAGIGQVFTLAKDFIGRDCSTLILGDNIFSEPPWFSPDACRGAEIVPFPVPNPAEFGVAEIDAQGQIVSLEEKPLEPRSNLAITGLYRYDNSILKAVRESKTFCLTEINQSYLRLGLLGAARVPEGLRWADAGTVAGLAAAARWVSGFEIGYPELASYRQGWINRADLQQLLGHIPESAYRQSLLNFWPKL